jgi:hypothetical protein
VKIPGVVTPFTDTLLCGLCLDDKLMSIDMARWHTTFVLHVFGVNITYPKNESSEQFSHQKPKRYTR